jgi:hypothetical protein
VLKLSKEAFQKVSNLLNLINPPWGDSFYKGNLSPAYNEWKGVLTLKILKTLDNYNRIEK